MNRRNRQSTGKRILHLTLHRKWFDEIASGRKKEEYRMATLYWARRFAFKDFDEVWFRNGYRKSCPFMRVEHKGTTFRVTEDGKVQYVIVLGKVLEVRNYQTQRGIT